MAATYLFRSPRHPGAAEIQLDLFRDYKSNIRLYPTFQQYFRAHRPPLLAIWGEHDPFFLPAGAKESSGQFITRKIRVRVRRYEEGYLRGADRNSQIALRV